MDKSLQDMKERLTRELTEMVAKRDITVGDLDVIYKAVKSIYYLFTIGAMDEYSAEGSMKMNTSEMGSYMSGYNEGYSEARRSRGSDGRYMSSMRGFSGHDSKMYMISEMEKMMQELDPRDQQAVRDCINKIQT